MARYSLVESGEVALRNIQRYERELRNSAQLQRRVGNVSAWYAAYDESGRFIFAPSKFVGYVDLDARAYLEGARASMAGSETERRLAAWFEIVPPDAPLAGALRVELDAFVAGFGRTVKKNARINMLKSDIARRPAQASGAAKLAERIVSDRDICGGRPRIRGTRMRVTDVLDLMAAGLSVPEILADYPYLAELDVAAAVDYAARALDHRVIRAA